MNKISIREDLHNQYINQISNMTFKELEDKYNELIELLNKLTENNQTYVISLINKYTSKYIKYCVDNTFYNNLQEAMQLSKKLNDKHEIDNEEYVIELVQDKHEITKLASIAYNLLKE